MTELTPASIVATLANISKLLEEKAEEVAVLDAEATRKRALYKRAFAEKFLSTEASNEVRRYTAELHTSQMLYEAEIADQVLRAAREALKVLRDRLEVGRSLGAIMRVEWTGGHSG
jgi:hypothetical protein